MFVRAHKNNRIESWLINTAVSNEVFSGSRHAAAIVHKKRVVSTGTNRKKTHPLMLEYGRNDKSIFLHAEIDAIVKAINMHGVEFLKDCSLYVLRISKDEKLMPSKPCKGCQRAIKAFGIKNVYYT